MEEDISKTTIIVLVTLTLVISMVGTWAVLDEVSSPRETVSGSLEGQVKLSIDYPEAPATDVSSAQVGITIAESYS